MALCKSIDVHGQSCLYVTGVEQTCSIEDITGFFKVYGEIAKVVRVPNEPEQPAGRVLLQYSSERSILSISPDSLGDLPSPKDSVMT